MEIEQDLNNLYRLCWFVEQRRQAEQAYSRAKWQLSYYRKAGATPEKIQEMRLNSLKAQKHVLDIRKKLMQKIGIVKNKLKAELVSVDGVIVQVRYPIEIKHTLLPTDWRILSAEQIAEMANEYEAERALNKALTK